MLAVNREEVAKMAEQLAILHKSLTDPTGVRVLAQWGGEQYPHLILAALVALTGEAIGYHGDVHLKAIGDAGRGQFIELDDPKHKEKAA